MYWSNIRLTDITTIVQEVQCLSHLVSQYNDLGITIGNHQKLETPTDFGAIFITLPTCMCVCVCISVNVCMVLCNFTTFIDCNHHHNQDTQSCITTKFPQLPFYSYTHSFLPDPVSNLLLTTHLLTSLKFCHFENVAKWNHICTQFLASSIILFTLTCTSVSPRS